jgi:hypothetical protein
MYIQRDLYAALLPFLKRKEVIAIHGPRQAGKTTFLAEIQKQMEKTKKTVKFLTFENRSDLSMFEKDIDDFKALAEGYDIVIIDEFQYAKEGGRKLKYLYDTTGVKFIISGSSSLELTYQTGKYMTGRMIDFTLWPFSFHEALSYADPEIYGLLIRKKSFGDTLNQRLRRYFEQYLLYGGYPAVVLAKTIGEKQKILESILESYLLRDIKTLLQLSTDDELIRLSRLLSAQAANLIEYNELGVSSGLNFNSLKKHLNILRETYVIDLLRPYYSNKRTELTKNPKVYFMDLGFRNLAINDFKPCDIRADIGALAENYVFSCLRRQSNALSPVRFWRTKSGAEVDFVLEQNGELLPIEVKYSAKISIGKSLYSFIEKYRPKRAIIYTKGVSGKEKIKDCRVELVPIYYCN